MLRNHLRIAWRSLVREKAYGAINLFGLAVGIAAVMLIMLYVGHEMDRDRFHKDADRMFRVLRVAHNESGDRFIGVTSGPYAEALKTDFPADVEAAVRVMPNDGLVTVGDRSFIEKRVFLADAAFFDFFSFQLSSGDPSTALAEPNSIVLTGAMAKKYFGNANPMGQIMRLDDDLDLKVSGVLAETKHGSHLQFDFLVPISIISNRSWFHRWWNNAMFTYVRLADESRRNDLEKQFPAFMDKYFGEDFKKSGNRMDLTLEPVKDIYLSKETSFDLVPHGDRTTLYMFLAVSLSILGIAALNFMNLSTARSAGRAMEVGIRKVMGASRLDLVFRFLGESMIMVTIATITAFFFTELLLPWINGFLAKDIKWPDSPWMVVCVTGIFVTLLGLGAGLYPAIVLSSFSPGSILKSGKVGRSRRAFWKALVVVQFSISVILIIGTLTIQRQMNFVGQKKLGFETSQTVVIPLNNRPIRSGRYDFRERLTALPGVESVTLASGEPGGFHDNMAFEIIGRPGDFVRMRTVFTDFDYAKTLGLKFVAGRDFSHELASDSIGIILNSKAVEFLGWTPETALGHEILINLTDDIRRRVIGVVEDFHFSSLKEEIQPLAISVRPDHRQVIVRMSTGDISKTLSGIENRWSEISPKYPFEYAFLDDRFGQLYVNESKQQTLTGIFSLVAVVIACLGLFGLASFAAERRTKELGIRKVLGASTTGLVTLFAGEFIALVLASVVVAVPVSYYMMNLWLQDFAYRTTVSFGVVAGSSLIAMMVALLTVSYQAVRAANANPVESLRYE